MNLDISSFAQPGMLEQERLIMKARSDVDVGAYAVFISGVSEEGKPTSGKKIAFWFPDGTVKKRDLVVLHQDGESK
jgi:hypothetical protein